VTTGHGGQLTVNQALHLAGQAEIIPVVIGTDGVLGYGRSRRIATASQRRALAARDGGCCFPGCDHPPDWTEVAHHLTPWEQGGKTDLNDLALLCDHHHDHHQTGWRIQMRDGRPWAIPPPWTDPTQTPTRSTMHDTTLDPVPAA
jgi:HNH endonuclease